MNYTIDTNIITALMKNDEGVKRKLQEMVFYGKEVFINGISYYEIKRGLLAANATKQLNIFDEICKKLGILLLDNQGIFDIASEIYADLKQRGELITDADILIAAIALTQNLILVSDNTKHFQRIRDITLENWLS
ncbi:MAG: type II toxin-antitoxin system VapC family toxin [Methanobacteriota archaeon]